MSAGLSTFAILRYCIPFHLSPHPGPCLRIQLITKFLLFVQVGKAEFLGRALGRPTVTLVEDNYRQPSLEWFQIHRGNEEAGELLATFQMFEARISSLSDDEFTFKYWKLQCRHVGWGMC